MLHGNKISKQAASIKTLYLHLKKKCCTDESALLLDTFTQTLQHFLRFFSSADVRQLQGFVP